MCLIFLLFNHIQSFDTSICFLLCLLFLLSSITPFVFLSSPSPLSFSFFVHFFSFLFSVIFLSLSSFSLSSVLFFLFFLSIFDQLYLLIVSFVLYHCLTQSNMNVDLLIRQLAPLFLCIYNLLPCFVFHQASIANLMTLDNNFSKF